MNAPETRPPAGRIPDASAPGGATLADLELGRLGPRASWRGRYVILRAHATGGLGVISIALDETLGRKVALKQLREEHADNPHLRARFIREAEITGQLEHPGIIPLYSLGQDEDGRPYYAMKFVEGCTFEQAIAEHHARRAGAMTLRDLLRRLVEICHAVAYAHSQGFVHRDIKPANIMVGRFGETLLLDWGLARRVFPSAQETSDQPAASKPVGTPAYMSPEQARGAGASVGPPSDVYGLGAVLYQVLTGRPPYQGKSSGEILDRLLAGAPPSPATLCEIAPPLEALCRRTMNRDAGHRPSAIECADEIERFLSDEPMASYRSPLLDRVTRWARHHRVATAAAVSSLIAATVALAIGTVVVTREKDAKVAALISESRQRGLAESREARLRRHLYAASMRDAIRAWNDGHGGRASVLLLQQHPQAGELDLRGFEWHLLQHQLSDARAGELRGAAALCGGMAISRDGDRIAAGVIDGTVQVWSLSAGQIVATLRGLKSPPTAVTISPDGSRIAASTQDGSIWVWSAASGERLKSLFGHQGAALDAEFSPDGAVLATCGADGTLRLWKEEPADPKVVALDAGQLQCCAFAPDGKSIAVGASDGTARIVELPSTREVMQMKASRFPVRVIAFSPDGGELAGASAWNVLLWDAHSGHKLASHEGVGGAGGLTFSDDGRLLAIPTAGGQLQILERSTGLVRAAAAVAPVADCAFAPGSQVLWALGDTDTLIKFDVSRPPNPWTCGDTSDAVSALALGEDSSRALVGTSAGEVQWRDTHSGAVQARAWSGNAAVCAIAIDSSAKLTVSADRSGKLSFWDARTLQRRLKFDAHTAPIRTVDISPDGTLVVTAALDHAVKLWDASTGSLRAAMSNAGVLASFSPDGRSILTAGPQSPPTLRSAVDLSPIFAAPVNGGAFTSAAFSHDGKSAVLGMTGWNAILWDLSAPNAPPERLQTERFTVTAATFLDSGRRIVTANPYRSIQFWDPYTAEECGRFDVDVSMDSPVVVSRDGGLLGVITRDGRTCFFRGP